MPAELCDPTPSMVTRRPAGRSLTPVQQAVGLRHVFPSAVIRIGPKGLVWEQVVVPTPLSRAYRVRITYAMGSYPKVVVLDPALVQDKRGLLPHFFRDGSICLHEANQWDGSMFIVDTTVPWTVEWLAYYELWRASGHWYGNGEPDEGDSATAVPVPPAEDRPRNRAERRRYERDEARRARRERSLAESNTSRKTRSSPRVHPSDPQPARMESPWPRSGPSAADDQPGECHAAWSDAQGAPPSPATDAA